MNLDKKIPSGIDEVPFYDPEWVTGYMKSSAMPGYTHPAGVPVRDAVRWWLRSAARQELTDQHTLIFDSWTRFMDHFDLHVASNKGEYMTKGNDGVPAFDKWAVLRHRITIAAEVLNSLLALPCRVVVTMHNQYRRNEKGQLTDTIKPVMEGQFADRMASYFNFYVRQTVAKPGTPDEQYLWQVQSDDAFKVILPIGAKAPAKFVRAGWDSVLKYFSPNGDS